MESEKNSRMEIKIVSVNINGYNTSDTRKKLKGFIQWMENKEIYIILMQEINTNIELEKVKAEFKRVMRAPGIEIISAHSPYKSDIAQQFG
jgi:exonuclease III